ncbi:2Fe-2S iron-sulfur cluster-binding protein [Flavonifractor sp. AGMB03687]|uniref:2Fe-2S iron-sulfur cluster-binding protein n=1 Tax=Flavonifractor sp. AGMB03687 TaxID=2785133 RepID=UPI001ADF3CF4|nr:2Fe-2S iron-sulfur cluster-binding protein [Flavonifractor sp. AGMB03687]
MTVKIDRYDPESGRMWTDSFELPTLERRMTVMDVLEYITLHLDPTVAYYHHSVCDHGICGRCTLKVNGKNALACLTVVNDLTELHLGPAAGRTVVRDLVTRH